MKRTAMPLVLLLAVAPLTACGGGRAPSPPPGAEARATDARLMRALRAETWGEEQSRELRRLETELGAAALDAMIARVAADPAMPLPARANAVLLLGDRGAGSALGAFRVTARDTSHLLRAATMAAIGGILEARRAEVVAILETGLADPDPLVQSKALQSLGGSEPGVLRRYIAASPSGELRGLAVDLLSMALQRGAPWADSADVAAGTEMVRTATGGLRLVYRPTRTWATGPASVGELLVAPEGAPPRRIATDVEAVAGVVPVVLSPDERMLAVEAGRRIRVVDLETSGERDLGPGIAPRPLPFSERFVYLVEREAERRQEGRLTHLVYDVFETAFAGAAPRRIGTLRTTARPDRFGAYSPARLMRVEQRGPVFVLAVPGSDDFGLPSPF